MAQGFYWWLRIDSLQMTLIWGVVKNEDGSPRCCAGSLGKLGISKHCPLQYNQMQAIHTESEERDCILGNSDSEKMGIMLDNQLSMSSQCTTGEQRFNTMVFKLVRLKASLVKMPAFSLHSVLVMK